MTLAPLVSPDIRGVDGKPGNVEGKCAFPGCQRPAQQRHHLWPRSYLRGQPYEWVSIRGVLYQNTVGLCAEHHLQVTGGIGGHQAHIKFDIDRGLFQWWELGERERFIGLVQRQDMIYAKPEAARVRKQEGLCPSCGKPLRTHDSRQQKEGVKPRRVSTWTVVVPDDTEVGSDVMDDWIDQFAVMLGFGEAPARLRRYHVLAVILAWAAMSKEQLLADLEEAEFFAH